MEEKWIRRSEAAKMLGVSTQTVANYASAGVIHERKDRKGSGYYPQSEIEALAGSFEKYSAVEVQEKIKAYDKQLMDICDEKAKRIRFVQHFEGHWESYRKIVEACVDAICGGPMEDAFTENERYVLSCVLNLESLEYISRKLLITRERTRQIFMKALRKMSKFPAMQAAEHERYLKKREEVENLKLEIKNLGYDIKALSNPEVFPPRKETLTEEDLKNRRPYNIPLSEIGVSVRTSNCCRAMDIKTVGDLLFHDKLDFMRQRSFGRKSMNEVLLLLDKFGLKPGMLKEKEEEA